MKYIAFFSVLILLSCNDLSKKQAEKTISIDTVKMNHKVFEETFQQVVPDEYRGLLSDLMNQKDYTLLTAGNDSLFNSMPASWEALALYFNNPKIMNLLGANRYTLELIRKHKTYTLSFFSDEYKGELFALGSKSGRNSNKMKETKLTHLTTPSGNIAYEEAEIVIECQLFEITSVNPKDFYSEEGKSFIEKGYGEAKDYHKLVFGKITKIWIQKTNKPTNKTAVDKTPVFKRLKKSTSSSEFPLLSVSLITLLTYAFSYVLQKRKYITKLTHRKIWNVILLISFLISGLLGLFLIFPVNYHFTFSFYPTLRTLHVDLGIVMVIVSIFHCLWHIEYFKKMFSKRSILK